MALARSEKSSQRFYSLSAQIQRERKAYYDHLEAVQKGDLNVDAWLEWFLGCLLRAIQSAEITLASILAKNPLLAALGHHASEQPSDQTVEEVARWL